MFRPEKRASNRISVGDSLEWVRKYYPDWDLNPKTLFDPINRENLKSMFQKFQSEFYEKRDHAILIPSVVDYRTDQYGLHNYTAWVDVKAPLSWDGLSSYPPVIHKAHWELSAMFGIAHIWRVLEERPKEKTLKSLLSLSTPIQKTPLKASRSYRHGLYVLTWRDEHYLKTTNWPDYFTRDIDWAFEQSNCLGWSAKWLDEGHFNLYMKRR